VLVLVPAAFVGGIMVGRKTVSQKAPEVATPVPAAQPVAPPPAMIAAAKGDLDTDQLASQALEEYVKGNPYRAIELATRALTLNERQPLAARILAASRCKVRDRDGAQKAIASVEPEFRKFVKSVCHDEGIELR
jgi:hypothetical protein